MDAVGAAGDRAVHVPRENVAHVAMTREKPVERRCVDESNRVHAGKPRVVRRMMHEQDDATAPGRAELALQPVEPPGAEIAGVGLNAAARRSVQRVEENEAVMRVDVDGGLNEAVRVGRGFRKHLLKGRPEVVVANHEAIGNAQLEEQSPQPPVGGLAAIVREVAGQHDADGIGMTRVDVPDAFQQAFIGVQAYDASALGQDV